ncbi:hypothetical protein THRCLA_20348 [Thraustotheca clavata]|uniref:Uncharacterized protein n=1 Tax=Thraustotheca clavata TaxID=74557 RepID=A0A1W0A8E7_9STRA|nr:hypothetical protein THRCLA_20348 [Thraustotheca clavata]
MNLFNEISRISRYPTNRVSEDNVVSLSLTQKSCAFSNKRYMAYKPLTLLLNKLSHTYIAVITIIQLNATNILWRCSAHCRLEWLIRRKIYSMV